MLHWATQLKRPDIIKILIERGADVNKLDKWGRTPLHLAAASNLIKEAQELLKYLDLNPYLRDNEGHEALDIAIAIKDIEFISLLLKRFKTNVIRKLLNIALDKKSLSILMLAAATGDNILLLKFLLEQNLNNKETDDKGNTALLLAASKGRMEAMRLLLQTGYSDFTERIIVARAFYCWRRLMAN